MCQTHYYSEGEVYNLSDGRKVGIILKKKKNV